MSTDSKRWALPGIALVLILAAGTAPTADARDGSGIWVYNADTSFSIVNLTEYTLSWDTSKVSCASYLGMQCNLFPDKEHISIPPYRTIRNNFQSDGITPTNWDGMLTFKIATLEQYPFAINFKSEKAHGKAEDKHAGTWMWLGPGTNSTGWCTFPATSANDTWCHNRWTTPVNDKAHRNVMTLVHQKFMVALYSPNNKDIVIVVQQYSSNLGDESSKYKAFKLDWTYNPGSTMP